MKNLSLIAAAALGLLALAGCKEDKAPASAPAMLPVLPATPPKADSAVHRNWISIPALPVIQDAVFSLSPTFDGQRNPALMAQICGLARGELKQEQVTEFLRQNNVEVEKLPKQGDPLALLVNGDKAGQVTACAAYLSTSVLSAIDLSEFTSRTEAPAQAPAEDEPVKGKTKGKEKAAAKPKVEVAHKPSEPQLQVDKAALSVVLPVKLALARANADVFALIAAELQRRPGLSVAEYREQARQMFVKLAPVYLERIKAQLPQANTQYRLLRFDADLFAFSSTTGSLFEFSGGGLTLLQNSVIWYGQGKLLGQEYPLQVAYFDPSVDSLLAPAKQ